MKLYTDYFIATLIKKKTFKKKISAISNPNLKGSEMSKE